MSNIGDRLWNSGVTASSYSDATEKYQAAVLEQYKLCVEMADRISARRSLTNTFFLSLNSAVVALLGAVGGRLGSLPVLTLTAGLIILLGQCAAWYVIVRSYRQLNSAKFQVISVFEERLPAFAYSRAEWVALGEGRDWRRYLPLTHVEQWVPLLFAVAYVLGLLAVTLS
ncbi:hypothetical protein FDA94_09775 [Herbidospora galbida]|uniref:Small integral membrane protein n=1 Tax=Herbidospora galbida TaxID=2575442 RepID=A0A4V5V1C8_9ACTN|nr:hypothetical protein [Herbidospora galbida]TKK89223.1 hypothetical protein FDA94_09775 [Herbidospora galbida]